MSRNVLLDDLPSNYGGRVINTGFRQGLKYYRIQSDERFSDEEKVGLIIRCFFGDKQLEKNPLHYSEIKPAIDFISWFISGGEESEESGEEAQEVAKTKRPVFSFDVDSGRLYAAFWECYGINLRKADLHWWEFLELFWNISGKTRLMEVVDLRGREIPEKASAKEKARLRKAKKLYALDKTESKVDNDKTLKRAFDRW